MRLSVTRHVGVLLLLFAAQQANADTIFFDNFESGLGQWNVVYGQIVTDPLNPSNHVLNFQQNYAGGDTFTKAGISLTPGHQYAFALDYLGTDAAAEGYAALSLSSTWVSTDAEWLFNIHHANASQKLVNDRQWRSYEFLFTAPWLGGNTVWIALEQWNGYSNTPGTTYFDNVRLSDISAIPEPGSLMLLGLGLAASRVARLWRRR